MKMPSFASIRLRSSFARPANGRLDTLTSLRFVAALAIVFHHLEDFGFSWSITRMLPLDGAVSFFIVLSGFILFVVHGDIEGGSARKAYLVARAARIFPLHLATFVLLFVLLQGEPNRLGAGEDSLWSAVLNVLLLQAWAPVGAIFLGYNSVSWTLSVAVFLSVAFLFLAVDFRRRWPLALAGSALLVIGLATFSDAVAVANYDDPLRGVSPAGLVDVNPLARLFEFVVGMCAGLAYRRGLPAAIDVRIATAAELGVILLFAANLLLVLPFSDFFTTHVSMSGGVWFAHGGALLPSMALVIYGLAFQRGWISGLLRHPVPVFLGEISFAIYLVHQILLRAYASQTDWFTGLPPSYFLPLYFAVLFAVSAFLWRFVEVPARQALRAAYARRMGNA